MECRKRENTAELAGLRLLFKRHADLCQALANEHRLAILYVLGDDEVCVTDLSRALGIPVNTVSQHLRVLKERMVVRSRKEGQNVYYSVTNPRFLEGCALIRSALVEELEGAGDLVEAAHFLEPTEGQRGPSSHTT